MPRSVCGLPDHGKPLLLVKPKCSMVIGCHFQLNVRHANHASIVASTVEQCLRDALPLPRGEGADMADVCLLGLGVVAIQRNHAHQLPVCPCLKPFGVAR